MKNFKHFVLIGILITVLAFSACGESETNIGGDQLSRDTVGMSVDFETDFNDTYVAPKVMVAGSDLGEFKIYSEGAPEVLVNTVRDAIFNSIGKNLEISDTKDGKYIEIKADDSLEMGYYTAKVLNDGNIHLQADTATGLYFSVDAFTNAIKNMNIDGEVYELSLSKSGSYPPAFELFGENDERYFVCETSKDALSYEIGEEIVFKISLFAEGELSSCDRFEWKLKGDDGKNSSGSAPGFNGQMTLSTSLDNNGFD